MRGRNPLIRRFNVMAGPCEVIKGRWTCGISGTIPTLGNERLGNFRDILIRGPSMDEDDDDLSCTKKHMVEDNRWKLWKKARVKGKSSSPHPDQGMMGIFPIKTVRSINTPWGDCRNIHLILFLLLSVQSKVLHNDIMSHQWRVRSR